MSEQSSTTNATLPVRSKPTSLWRLPAVRLLAAYTFFGFTGFFSTLSALPAWMAGRGTVESVAGLITTTLLVATISTQTLVPKLLDRFGMTIVLGAGSVLLGAPTALLLISDNLWAVLGICILRGIGFGIVTVLGSTLTAQVASADRRGEAVGIYGLAIALPNLAAVAGGVALVTSGHFAIVVWLGVVPLLGVFTARPLARMASSHADANASQTAQPGSVPGAAGSASGPAGSVPGAAGSASGPAGSASGPGDAERAVTGAESPMTDAKPASAAVARRAARLAALGPAFVLMVVTLASGGFMTYLPIERPDGALATIALLVWGATGAFARWQVGLLADRSGLRILLPAASLLSIAGIGVVAAGLTTDGTASWIVVLLGSAILGVGFGATQNLTLVAAFAQAKQRETATVSSVWNVGFDSGTALGSGMVGLLTFVMAVPAALALTTVLIVISMPWAIRNGRPPA